MSYTVTGLSLMRNGVMGGSPSCIVYSPNPQSQLGMSAKKQVAQTFGDLVEELSSDVLN